MRFVTPAIGLMKRRPWRSAIAGALLLLVGYSIYRGTRPTVPEYILATAKRGELLQTVGAVGTVFSERDVKLQFPATGIVAGVFVKEGDRVKAGQKLAQLRAGDLAAGVSIQVANLRSAEAQLDALLEGSRPEDIAIAEADLENKRASLDAAQTSLKTSEESMKNAQQKLDALLQEADVALVGQRSVARSGAGEELTVASSGLASIDNVFANNDVVDALIKGDPGAYGMLHAERLRAGADIDLALGALNRAADDAALLAALQQSRAAISQASLIVGRAFNLITAIPVSAYFTTSSKETYRTTLDTQRAKVQGAVTGLETALKAFGDAAASLTTRIATERSALTAAQGAKDRALADIRTFETALRIAEAQLSLKTAPSRPTDIRAAQARVQQARADVSRASSLFGNTVLTAPMDGVITKVLIKAGEALPAGAAMEMLGSSPFRVEMFVSEIDVPKIQATQSGSIELDAFPGVHYALHVGNVDAAPTDIGGVSKYRVKLDFVHPHEEFKIGMSGDAEIVTGRSSGSILIPARAVLEQDGNTYVRVPSGTGGILRQGVRRGLEGEDLVEIMDGLKEGDTVIVLVK